MSAQNELNVACRDDVESDPNPSAWFDLNIVPIVLSPPLELSPQSPL